MFKRAVSGLVAVAAAGTLAVLVAAPAQAEVRGTCDRVVCIAADIVGNTVKDATVSTTDGGSANLHIFIGREVDERGNGKVFRIAVNKAFDSGTLVCGEAWAGDGHLLGRPCIRV